MNSQRIAKTSFARLALTWVFFLALILHLPGFAQSTVSGTVSLADSAVPAGISVYFNATSPSAASDTAVTDSAGFYSISLQNGQYEILFEKDGYLSETVEVLLLSQNTTIDSTTLQVKTVELISGTIPSGTWTADKEYLINGDAELSFGDTLVVEPGTQITLASAVDWNVFGMIYLQGTEEEYIQIDIASTGFAGQITFAYTSTIDPADVVYTHFTGIGESHVFINQDPVDFRNCIFDKIELIYEFGNQIEETESIVEITSNQFINSRMNLGTGDKDEEIKYTIDGNTFFHDGSQSNSFTAISTLRLDTLIVSGNTIQGYNLAIYSNNVETLEINKNQFIKNQEGMHLDFGDFFTPEASIIQNTFYQNTAGIHLNAVNADVNSNLFLENNYDLKINTYGTITVNYNLFEDTTQIFLEENEFSIPPSLSNTGLILTTQNGWPADIYFNIFIDPEVGADSTNESQFLRPLSSNSPAVNSGDPDLLDADGTAADIGALNYLNQAPSSPDLLSPVGDTLSRLDSVLFTWGSDAADPDSFGTLNALIYTLHIDNGEETTDWEAGMDTSFWLVDANIYQQNLTHLWWVTASDGIDDSTPADTATFFVDNVAPEAFSLTAPSGNSNVEVTDSVEFSWSEAVDTDEVTYVLSISGGTQQDTAVTVEDVTAIEVSWLTSGWAQNATYTYSVLATDGQDSTYSDTLSFTMDNLAPQTFALLTPSNGDTYEENDSLSITWEAAEDTDTVTYQITLTGTGVDTTYSTTETSLTVLPTWVQNQEYTLQVSATDGQITTLAAGVTLTVNNIAPEGFALVTPLSQTFNGDPGFQDFIWETAADADEVTYTWYLDLEGNDPVITLPGIRDTAIGGQFYTPGTHKWWVVATDGLEQVSSDTAVLVVINQLPSEFNLLTPANGSELSPAADQISFTWTAATDPDDAVSYTFYLLNEEDGSEQSFAGLNSTTLVFDGELENNTSYTWWLVATDGFDEVSSDTATFLAVNQPPNAFALISPANGEEVTANSAITFAWGASTDPDGSVTYSVHVRNQADNTQRSSESLTDTTWVYNTGFDENTAFTWWVVATDGLDSVSSDTLAFTVPNVAPSAFSFTDPSPLSSINQNEFVTFRWGRAEDNATVNYTLRITGGTLDTLLATGTSRTARERLDWVQNVTYQAYVWATDGVDTTASDTVAFTINNVAPTAIALLTPENGTTLDATQPIPFSWTASTDEETLTYLLQIQGFGTDTVVSTSETSLDYDGIGLQDDSTYTWQVTVTDGVDSLTTDSRTFVAINTVTGLFDWPKAPTWDMYPNPASNAIRLEGLEMSAQSIQILNATGQIVVDVQRVANMDPIFVEHLPEGIYQVVMVGTETISSRTLLIRR